MTSGNPGRFLTAALPACFLAIGPVSAQDFSGMASDSLSSAGSFTGTVGVNAHLEPEPRAGTPAKPASLSPRSRAVCRNQALVAAKLSAAKARRLQRLCADAGY